MRGIQGKLLSPPVSPGQSKKSVTLFNKDGSPWMAVKAPILKEKGKTKASIMSFLSHYENRAKQPGSFISKKRAYSPKVVNNSGEIRERRSSRSAAASDTSSEHSPVFVRSYSTRSKSIPRSPVNTPPEEIITLMTKCNESDSDFFQGSSVQLIHDAPLDELPDFQPSTKHITPSQLEAVIAGINLNISNPLKDDEGLELVDAKEVSVVSAVKLTPLQYLDTKKRFFAEKARKTRLKAAFKKTDAQKACKIDVNKASKLYEVFQRLGLLEDELFL
jgi:hypothetical protein